MNVLREVSAVNLGLSTFADALRAQGAPVVDVDWRPPAGGDAESVELLTRLWGEHGDAIAEANSARRRRHRGRVAARGHRRAGPDVVPGIRDGLFLHSGPPITWDRVCDPQRRALVAAVLFEGWEPNRAAATAALERGEIALEPGNEHDHVGPMTGVCSPSMPVWVVGDGSHRASRRSTKGRADAVVRRRRRRVDRAAAVLP